MRFRVVRAEATTGLLLAGGLLTVAIAVLLSALGQSEPLWSDRTRTTTLICVFTMPLLVGISAIVAQRRVAGLGPVAAASPTGRLHPAIVVGLAGSVWALVVFVVQAIIPLLVRTPTDTLPWTALLPWLQALASLVGGTWLGAWCGSRIRASAAGPMMALGLFAILYGANYLPGRLRLAAPFDSPWYVPWIQPAPGAPLGHTAVAAAMAIASVGALAGTNRHRVFACAVSVLLVASGVATIASVPSAMRYEPRPMPTGPVCRDIGDGVSFCTHPLAGKTGDDATRALIEVRSIVGDRWQLPARLVHHDMTAVPGAREVPMSYGADWAAHLSNAVLGLSPQCATTTVGLDSREQVQQWLAARVGLVRPSTGSPLFAVLASDEQDQDAWLRGVLRDGQCR